VYGRILARCLVYRRPFPSRAIAPFRLKKQVNEDEFVLDFDLAQPEWSADDQAKVISDRYDVANWVSVNTVITLSWHEWINFDPLLKRAVVMEVNNIVKEREKLNNRREQEMKMEMLKINNNMPLKDMRNTSMGNLMSK
jgi:hypothetical protein